MILAKLLHILGFTVWVGGMFFAHMALRPVANAKLEPAQRLPLMGGVLGKFFTWVWGAVAFIIASGGYMMAQIGKPPVYVAIMAMTGVIMMFIFGHIYFVPNRRLQRAIAAQDWKAGGAAMAQIRKLVVVNLILGLITVVVATLGQLAA